MNTEATRTESPASSSIVNLTIHDVAFGGDGVGRLADGCVVFVPFTLPGEEVRVEVRRTQPRFARGRLLSVITPAATRVTPPCPLYGRCGGCQYQHLDYAAQPALKAVQLATTLKRLGKLPELPEIAAPGLAPQPYHYRNKIRLEPIKAPVAAASGSAPAAGLDYGFFALDNSTVLPVAACPLASASLNALLATAKASPEALQNAAAMEPGSLTLRQPGVGAPIFYFGDAARSAAALTEELLGRPVSVPAGGFWQVNPAVAEELVRTVAGWLGDTDMTLLVDAYGGVGAFSLALGRAAQHTVLIETSRAAVTAAAANRAAWGLPAAELLAQPTEVALPVVLRRTGKGQVKGTLRGATVVLDPPRTGCQPEVLRALVMNPVQRLLYVSCNASTLARDLQALCVKGPYKLQRLALFDMFPQTAHFETACLLGT